jgi:hypothetical protein
MSFNREEYFYLAQELSSQSFATSAGEEAKLRASVSRANYACYCMASIYLREVKNIILDHEHPHQDIVICFKTKFQNCRTALEIGENLNRLLFDRKKADYDNIVSNLNSTSISDLIVASSTITLVKSLPKEIFYEMILIQCTFILVSQ